MALGNPPTGLGERLKSFYGCDDATRLVNQPRRLQTKLGLVLVELRVRVDRHKRADLEDTAADAQGRLQ